MWKVCVFYLNQVGGVTSCSAANELPQSSFRKYLIEKSNEVVKSKLESGAANLVKLPTYPDEQRYRSSKIFEFNQAYDLVLLCAGSPRLDAERKPSNVVQIEDNGMYIGAERRYDAAKRFMHENVENQFLNKVILVGGSDDKTAAMFELVKTENLDFNAKIVQVTSDPDTTGNVLAIKSHLDAAEHDGRDVYVMTNYYHLYRAMSFVDTMVAYKQIYPFPSEWIAFNDINVIEQDGWNLTVKELAAIELRLEGEAKGLHGWRYSEYGNEKTKKSASKWKDAYEGK